MDSIKEIKTCSPTDSVRVDYREIAVVEKEETWPRDWRAYVALFGGFLLMFNSWYVTLSLHLVQAVNTITTGAWSIPLEPFSHTIKIISCPTPTLLSSPSSEGPNPSSFSSPLSQLVAFLMPVTTVRSPRQAAFSPLSACSCSA